LLDCGLRPTVLARRDASSARPWLLHPRGRRPFAPDHDWIVEVAPFVIGQRGAPLLDRRAFLHELQQFGTVAPIHVVDPEALEPLGVGRDVALALGLVGAGPLHGPAPPLHQPFADGHPIAPHAGLRLLDAGPGQHHKVTDALKIFFHEYYRSVRNPSRYGHIMLHEWVVPTHNTQKPYNQGHFALIDNNSRPIRHSSMPLSTGQPRSSM